MQISSASSIASIYLTSPQSPVSPVVQAANVHKEAAETRTAERSESAVVQVREGEAAVKVATSRLDIYA